jgi:23S rRNA (pseudouridine1915-N3)-methyltransferase
MKIEIIAVGRLKNSNPLCSVLKEYTKQLKTIHVTEIDERKFKDKNQQNQYIVEVIPDNSYVIALDEKGTDITSQNFAALIQKKQETATDICFIIGGADGLNEAALKKAHKVISFGKSTWPHMMVRIMLVEQIYRAHQINNGHPYHRD